MPHSVQARRAGLAALTLGLCAALAACTHPVGARHPQPSVPAAASGAPLPAALAVLLDRPLGLPSLATGGSCPVTQPTALDPPPPPGHPLTNAGSPIALGRAPVFPDAYYFGLHGRPNLLQLRSDATRPGWYITKAPWASRPGYRGWALIRAARIDGAGQAQVQVGDPDDVRYTQLGDAAAVNVVLDWQFMPGGIQVTTPGCYAYQVDTTGATDVIVFEAAITP
jgi:hypothetical protein